EAKFSCLTNDDTTTLEYKVDNVVEDVLCELGYNPIASAGYSISCDPTPTPTPTLTPTPNGQLCGGSAPACNGACPTDAGDCRNVGGTCMCVGGRPTETPTPMPTP